MMLLAFRNYVDSLHYLSTNPRINSSRGIITLNFHFFVQNINIIVPDSKLQYVTLFDTF